MKIKEATKKGYLEANPGDGINISGRMEYQRGNVQKGMAQTLKTQCEVGVIDDDDRTERERESSQLRIRKLTPKECLRLMGFEDKDYDSLREIGMSDAAIYHMAGDSIVTTCLIGIFSQFIPNANHTQTITNMVERIKNGS